MNAIMTIHPYKHGGQWVFDDPAVGLVREPFVSGADKIIDKLVDNIPDPASGFTLLFSAQPFPGFDSGFARGRAEHGGYWYSNAVLGEGWLCPALFKYFKSAPARLFVKASGLSKATA